MKFVMPRDRVVVSKFGRAFDFVKGEPLHVPDMCWDEVQAAGAVPEEELPTFDEDPSKVLQGAERVTAIGEAIKSMVLKGQREDFSASGAPNAAVLSSLVGFRVDAKERDAAWALIQTEGA